MVIVTLSMFPGRASAPRFIAVFRLVSPLARFYPCLVCFRQFLVQFFGACGKCPVRRRKPVRAFFEMRLPLRFVCRFPQLILSGERSLVIKAHARRLRFARHFVDFSLHRLRLTLQLRQTPAGQGFGQEPKGLLALFRGGDARA